MGTAIIIPGITFDDTFGKVTLSGNKAPVALHIVAQDSYTAHTAQLSVDYEPINTSARGVVWSITAGGNYATIDENGKLTIDSSASSSPVTFRVVSAADGDVYDTKTITVTYANPITILEKVSITGNPTLNTQCALYDDTYSVEMKYKVTGAAGHVGMLWGTLDEHSAAYAEDMNAIIVDYLADSDRKPVMTGSIVKYSTPISLNTLIVDEFAIDGMKRDGEQVTNYTTIDSAPGFSTSHELYILHPTSSYMFTGIDIYHFKVKKGGVVVHDFRAAVNDGVYGFYDVISNNFISNTGNYGTITA